MDDFANESSIAGAKVFHTSEPKKVRILWLFVNILVFIVIGFYVRDIHRRYKVEPEFSFKFSQMLQQEIPFPAVTICSPLFARNQSMNLQEFLKNPKQNLTEDQQNILAANVQACVPEWGPKIDKFCPLADPRKTIEFLKLKHPNVNDFFQNKRACVFSWARINCSNIFNHVLTDFGFCFTYNLEGFTTIFNTEIISDDFKSYSRDGKIVKNYLPTNELHHTYIYEANQSIDWNLEKGFLTNSKETLPIRALNKKSFHCDAKINGSDLTNLCPKIGRNIAYFLHMPNEILTPFHQPRYFDAYHSVNLMAKVWKVDESLRPYPPEKRNCYFEGERKLKFFKTYTKALCEFECLANFTLVQCGCVKFSMPRESSARICGLNETSCYIQVAKNWNLTCGCLHPCTYIEYSIDKLITKPEKLRDKTSFRVEIKTTFTSIFGEKVEVSGVYDMYQCFADFGGMLGTFFGASLLSLIEIFYFPILNFVKNKFNIQESNEIVESSKFGSSSTIHGVQFIFDKSRHKFIRSFWTLVFILAFCCCIYDSRESYWKLSVKPEMETLEKVISVNKIPFPAITIRPPIMSKANISFPFENFYERILKNETEINELSFDDLNHMVAYAYTFSGSLSSKYLSLYYKNVKNIKNYKDHRSGVDLFPYLNRSQLEVDEILFDCKFQQKSLPCSKLFKKVMTVKGICYNFNIQTHQELFNEGISRNFDSYGKSEKTQKHQWSLDQGYLSNKSDQHPARASEESSLEVKLRIRKEHFENVLYYYKFYFNLPSEILSQYSTDFYLDFYAHHNVSFELSATSKRMELKLRKFSPVNRGCYFQDEKGLQFFKAYTRSNCIYECYINYTLETCGCVAYLLPHNNSMRICESANEAECFFKIMQEFPPTDDSVNPCSCLPTCNDIDYSWEMKTDTASEASKSERVSNLKFQFVSPTIKEKVTRMAFGPGDFLTNVGGFFGLYLGCSMISVFEVFYFLSAFLYAKLTRIKNEPRREEIKSDSENEPTKNKIVLDLEESDKSLEEVQQIRVFMKVINQINLEIQRSQNSKFNAATAQRDKYLE